MTVPRGALDVYLVDSNGDLVLEDFVVHATPHRIAAAGGRRALGNGAIALEEGRATFDSLSPGRYVVEATHRQGDRAGPVEVEVRPYGRL